MNIWDLLPHYATPWAVLEERQLTDEEKAVVAKAIVTKGDYGKSVCFHMTYGGMTFISIDEDNSSVCAVGDNIDIDKMVYKKLEKTNPDGSKTTCTKVIV